MSAAPAIQLYLLGTFRLEAEGQPLRLPTRKAEALFAYLALHPGEHSREQLAALFWGDSPDEDARRSLRVALSSVRKSLGDEDLLLAERDAIQLNPAKPIWIDVNEIADLKTADPSQSAIGTLKTKIDLYRGPLLPDLYDDWVLPLRDEYHAVFVNGLLGLIQNLRSQSNFSTALELAHKLLAVEPANERAHQFAMLSYEALGDRSAALKQFDECKRRLWGELAVEPSPETLALADRLRQAPAFSPLPTATATNLPEPNTSFVGRDDALREVKQLLWTTRLITFTGAGGAGKTRLAIRVGSDLTKAGVFPDGVWWVELAAINEAARVPQAIAKVLGVHELAEGGEVEALTYILKPKHTLLILDNCEHLIEACAALSEKLLIYCPNLTIITTSREALNIPGEVVWQVPSLLLPVTDRLDPADLARWEGIQLFIERASAVNPNFALTTTNAQAVLRICHRLDGIPLAIELAAARLKAISVEQVAARLDDRFKLLTTGSRTALPRQQTLRALIDWSYDLLSEPERVLLRRLSIFTGGCTLEAAEQVTGTDPLAADDVLDLLTKLVDKSLVVFKNNQVDVRYTLLETIKQYGLEKLAQSGELDVMYQRHLNYFSSWMAGYETYFESPNLQDVLWQMDADHNNIRAALEWAATPNGDRLAGAGLAAHCGLFWHTRGYLYEGAEHFKPFLPHAKDIPDVRLRAKLLCRAGLLANELANYAFAYDLYAQSVAFSRVIDDRAALADELFGFGTAAFYQLRFDEARIVLEDCVALCKEINAPFKLNRGAAALGRTLLLLGQDEPARALIEETLEQAVRIRDTWGQAYLWGALGDVRLKQRDLNGAWEAYEKSLTIARTLDDGINASYALQYLSHVANLLGEYARSGEMAREALDIYRRMGYLWGEPFVIRMMGYAALYTGDLVRAHELCLESLQSNQAVNSPIGVIASLNALGALAAASEKYETAATLLGVVDRLRAEVGIELMAPDTKAYGHTALLASAALGEADFEAAKAQGAPLSVAEAARLVS